MDPSQRQYGHEALLLSKTPEYIRCAIRDFVLQNPIQFLTCGHRFCAPCFSHFKELSSPTPKELSCPVARELIDLDEVCENYGLRGAADSVKCNSWEHGCSWQGVLADLDQHKQNCEYQPQPQGEICSSSQNLNNLLADVGDLRRRMDAYDLELEKKEKENAALKYSVLELKEQCGNMAKEMDSLNHRIDNTDMELKLSKERTVMSEREISLLKQRIGELDVEVHIAKDQNTALLKEVDLIKENNRLLERKTVKMKVIDHDLSINDLAQSEEVKSENDDKVGMSQLTQNPTQVLKSITRFKCTPDDVTLLPNLHIKFNENPDNSWNYSTVIVSDCRVPKGGKAFYEVTLLNCECEGLRVGWVNVDFLMCKRSKSVGGCSNSYGYDPVAGWKVTSTRRQFWGPHFDTDSHQAVGVTIDMVRGEVIYGVNGKWNVAFQDINKNCSYFPALTGGAGVYVSVNFGERDFKFGPPQKSYANLIDSCS